MGRYATNAILTSTPAACTPKMRAKRSVPD